MIQLTAAPANGWHAQALEIISIYDYGTTASSRESAAVRCSTWAGVLYT